MTFTLNIDGKTSTLKAHQRRDYGAGWGQAIIDMGAGRVGVVSTVDGAPMGDIEVLKVKRGLTAQKIAADKGLTNWARGRAALLINPDGAAETVYVSL